MPATTKLGEYVPVGDLEQFEDYDGRQDGPAALVANL
jgi:hypothetical protein